MAGRRGARGEGGLVSAASGVPRRAARAARARAHWPAEVSGRGPRRARSSSRAITARIPAFRTEWWYVTGWLRAAMPRDLGFQVTFFRSRRGSARTIRARSRRGSSSSRMPRSPIRRSGRLLHDQRAARAGFGLAAAREGSTDVHIDDWSLTLAGGVYRTRIARARVRVRSRVRAVAADPAPGRGGLQPQGSRSRARRATTTAARISR